MLNHKGTTELNTERLLLRRLELSDAAAIHINWGSDSEVYRYMTSPIMPTIPDVVRFLHAKEVSYQEKDYYYWGIFLKSEPESGCIGMVTLTEVSDFSRTANLAYSLGRPWWRQGIATEAAFAVCSFAFEMIGFHKLYGCHFTENERSGRVLLKVGMKYQGRGTNSVLHDGRYLTYENYEITRHEWRQNQRNRAAGSRYGV